VCVAWCTCRSLGLRHFPVEGLWVNAGKAEGNIAVSATLLWPCVWLEWLSLHTHALLQE